jgi:hypothetical protein
MDIDNNPRSRHNLDKETDGFHKTTPAFQIQRMTGGHKISRRKQIVMSNFVTFSKYGE